ncbi:hypothetical protein GQ54DRAFT_295764 [Martensiomyces pterosporus]|nr:hypothetical protein GQ54DRAFT_295764 [Martensiomyces pterosporus]
MLFRFGQRLQAQEKKAARQQQQQQDALTSRCSQCNQQFGLASSSGCCHHCTKPVCPGCTQTCFCCHEPFCSTCSMYDYSLYDTRAVCFDCNS